MNGYIQIYTVEKNILNPDGLEIIKVWKILITPNEENIHNIYNDILITNIKNINIVDTFKINLNKIIPIFMHARNKYLIGSIKDGILLIVGDSKKILLNQQLNVSYTIEPIEITLKANNNFLDKYGLPLF